MCPFFCIILDTTHFAVILALFKIGGVYNAL